MKISKQLLQRLIEEAFEEQGISACFSESKSHYSVRGINALLCCGTNVCTFDEGQNKTYPTATILNALIRDIKARKGINIPREYFNCKFPDKENKVYSTVVLTIPRNNFFSEEELAIVKQHFTRGGYFLASIREVYGFVQYQFDAKYQGDSEKPVVDTKLYHVTTQEKANKILKNGLHPRTQSDRFTYPDRVYLFTRYDEKLFREYIKRSKKKSIVGKIAILEIDNSDFKAKCYWDPKYGYDIDSKAVFTYSNIGPDKIKQVGSFEI